MRIHTHFLNTVFVLAISVWGFNTAQAAPLDVLDSLYTAARARAVAVNGNYAYVVDYANGLKVIDVSTPTSPQVVGYVETNGRGYDIVISGNYAYITGDTTRLDIVDISNPTDPSLVGSYTSSGFTEAKMTISGNFIYMAAGTAGLIIVDVSDPTNPALAATLNTTGQASEVVLNGSHAYVADSTSGLQVIDVSNPLIPTLITTLDLGVSEDIAVSGNHLLIIDSSDDSLQVVDITNPVSPSLLTSLDVSASNTNLSTITISENVVYLGGQQLSLIDISTPTLPTLINTHIVNTTTEEEDIQLILGIDVSGDRVYVAADELGLLVFDVSTPTTSTLLGETKTQSESTSSFAIHANHLYALANTDNGFDKSTLLMSINTSAPTDLIHEATYTAPNPNETQFSFSVSDDLVCISEPLSTTIEFIDPSNLTELLDQFVVSRPVYGTTLVGNSLYALADNGDLYVIDITNPVSPALTTTLLSSGPTTRAITSSGNTVYLTLASGSDAILVQAIDVSNPATPRVLSTLTLPYDNGIFGTVATESRFFLQSFDKLQIVNTTDPTNMIHLGNYDPTDTILSFDAQGNYAYLALGSAGVSIIDVSDPTNIMSVASRSTGVLGYVDLIVVDDSVLYVNAAGIHSLEGLPTFYQDSDGDGYGNTNSQITANQPAGYVTTTGDCNDADNTVSPGATDTCGDGIDQDCSGSDTNTTCSTPDPDPTPVVTTSSGGGGCNLNTGIFQTGNMGLISAALLLLLFFQRQKVNQT